MSSDRSGRNTYYEFFPSVRAGYRPERKYGDKLKGRTKFGVDLTVEGREDGGKWTKASDSPSMDIRMYGPGDVSGIGDQQVVRMEPEPETSTMPPNYFPFVELRRADLPWLFSPARANANEGGKAQPWCCLVVVPTAKDSVTVEAAGRKPNPALTVPQTQLPPVEEAWAWVHAQVVGRLSDSELERAFTGQSSQAVARLLCPRNLDPNTRYLAAIVPTFEPGRRVGLGKEPFSGDGKPTLDPAWNASKETEKSIPVYHQWEFATGSEGDFESLVRDLEPRNLSDSGVGKREIDLSDPGPAQLEDPDQTFEVGGALVSPGLEQTPLPKTEGDEDLQKRRTLRQLLNSPDAAAGSTGKPPAGGGGTGKSSLPVVGPPIYGQWYLPRDAGWQRGEHGRPEPPDVPTGGPYFDAWIHELNVDPRWRIPAGYGTEVVQENQETLMEAAWKQFGDIERANQRVGRGQAGDVVGSNVRDRFDRSGAHAVGSKHRVRDFDDLQREIAAAGRLTDEGALGDHRTTDPVEDRISGTTGETGSLSDRDRSKRLLQDGTLDVDGTAAGVDSATAERRVNQLRLQGAGTFRSDGAGTVTPDPTTLARFATLTSPSYRRLTRTGGKLDRGVDTDSTRGTFVDRLSGSVPFETDATLGSRFARANGGAKSTRRESGTQDDRAPASTEPTEPSETTTDTAAGDQQRRVTAWRVDASGHVLSLAEAADELEAPLVTVPKALLAVESARDHCETARDRLLGLQNDLAGSEAEFPRSAVAAVTERPTVEDQCAAIRDNTFDVLDRQFGKLLATSPEPVDDDFTQAEKAARLGRVRQAHGRLVSAVQYVTDAVQSGSDDPAVVEEKVTEALSAIDDIKLGLEELAEPIDRGLPAGGTRVMSGEMPSADTPDQSAPPTPDTPPGSGRSGPSIDRSRFVTTAAETERKRLFDGTAAHPGQLDAGAWAQRRTARDVHSGLLDRQLVLDRIVGSPEFDQPMYEWLTDLDEQYLLPGVDDIQKNTIGALESNSEFIESFMCGLNHEMARELQWRRFPTDRRGTYFRQFWDYIGTDQPDIRKLTSWQQRALGDNRAPGIEDNRVVLIVRGDLLRVYPSTRIYAVKAVKEDKSGAGSEATWDRVPLLESLRDEAIEQRRKGVAESDQLLRKYTKTELDQSAWDPKEPVFRGTIDPDITFLGFDLETEMAVGGTIDEDTPKDELGWFFVLEERVGETRFGLDVPARGDYGSVPYGVRTGPATDRSNNEMDTAAYEDGAEKGWSGLSWGHLVSEEKHLENKRYVRVAGSDGDRPSGGKGEAPWAVKEGKQWYSSDGITETWDAEYAAQWGTNSAHMARITWQLPVRVCIHADDILPNMTEEGSGWYRRRKPASEVSEL